MADNGTLLGRDVAVRSRNPVLFIGLGGYGGRMVNRLAEKARATAPELEGVHHFLCLDTEADALDRLEHVPVAGRIRLSRPYPQKRQYVREKLGLVPPVAADPAFVRSVPESYIEAVRANRAPRDTLTGAGQFRLESRIDLYLDISLGASESQVRKALRRIDQRVKDPRANQYVAPDSPLSIMILTSLGGGTGSGLLVPLASLVKATIPGCTVDLVALLPQVTKTDEARKRRVYANGYAALKEIEFVQRLTRRSDATKTHERSLVDVTLPPAELPLVVDPQTDRTSSLDAPPFRVVFLVADPAAAGQSVERMEQVVSDFCWVLLEGGFDSVADASRCNFGGELGTLSNRYYVSCYSTFASAMLLVPQRDIAAYCTHRWAADALRLAFARTDDGREEDAKTGDPLVDQLHAADRRFLLDLEERARVARQAREKSGATEPTADETLVTLTRPGISLLDKLLGETLELWLREARRALVPSGPGISNKLKAYIQAERFLSDGTGALSALADELQSGVERSADQLGRALGSRTRDFRAALRRLLRGQRVFGAERRYLLVKLILRIHGELAALAEEGRGLSSLVLDDATFRSQLGGLEAALRKAAPYSLAEKVKEALTPGEGRNRDFIAAKSGCVERFEPVVIDSAKRAMLHHAGRLCGELLSVVDAQLTVFRDYAGRVQTDAERLEEVAERVRRTGVLPDGTPGDAVLFERDREALLGSAAEGENDRLWGLYYERTFRQPEAPYPIPLNDVNRLVMDTLTDLVAEREAEAGEDADEAVAIPMETLGERVRSALLGLAEECVRPVVIGEGGPEGSRGLLLDEALAHEYAQRLAADCLEPEAARDFESYCAHVLRGDFLSLLRPSAEASPSGSAGVRQAVDVGVDTETYRAGEFRRALGALKTATTALPESMRGATVQVAPTNMPWHSAKHVGAVALREVLTLRDYDAVGKLHTFWEEYRRAHPREFLYCDRAFAEVPPLEFDALEQWARERLVRHGAETDMMGVFAALWKGWLVPKERPEARLELTWDSTTVPVPGLADWGLALDGLGARGSMLQSDIDTAVKHVEADSSAAREFLEKVPDLLREWMRYADGERQYEAERRAGAEPGEKERRYERECAVVLEATRRFEETETRLRRRHGI